MVSSKKWYKIFKKSKTRAKYIGNGRGNYCKI